MPSSDLGDGARNHAAATLINALVNLVQDVLGETVVCLVTIGANGDPATICPERHKLWVLDTLQCIDWASAYKEEVAKNDALN